MRTKGIRRISLVLVPILVAMTVSPVAAAVTYTQPAGTTSWFGEISQWFEDFYSDLAGSDSTSTVAGESGSNVAGESGSNCKGESGSNVAGESGSNLTISR